MCGEGGMQEAATRARARARLAASGDGRPFPLAAQGGGMAPVKHGPESERTGQGGRPVIPRQPMRAFRILHPLEVSQTPASVTARPTNMAGVRGSPNSAQAQSMVTGGLR